MHFLFENRSLVDFQIGNERKGRELGGDGCIYSFRIDHWSILKERTSEKAGKSEVTGAFPYLKIDHWSIFKLEMSEKAAKSEVTGAFRI